MIKKHLRKQGTTLMAVLVVTTALTIILGSVLAYVLTEKRISESNRLYNEARLAAETALEHGFAQLQSTFSRNASLVTDALNPFGTASSPLILGGNFRQVFNTHVSDSRVVLPPNPYVAEDFLDYETFVVAGMVTEPIHFHIDPEVPGNENNPSAGTSVRMNTVDVFAKATVRDARHGDRVAYVKQTFQIIDQSLFDHAVFYSSGDLEINPGPNMVWSGTGPVHSNYDVYVGAGNTLSFNVRVSSAGDFFAKRHPLSGQSNSNGTINMLNGLTNSLVDLRVGGSYLDSDREDFRRLASERFRGGLMSQEHGVQQRYPVGIGELAGLFAHQEGNWEHHLIAPPGDIPAIESDLFLNAEQKHVLKTVEEIKFSTRAGLTLEMNSSGTVSVFAHQQDSDGTIVKDSSGHPIKIELEVPAGEEFWTVEPYSATGTTNTSTVTSGLYDYRQGAGSSSHSGGRINLLKIDVAAMRDLLENPTDGSGTIRWKRKDTGTTIHPENWWNGGVYVRMPDNPSATIRTDRVVPSHPNWAVQMTNGATLPNPSYAIAKQNFGLTVATNSSLYVHGNYNAPTGGGTATDPENSATFAQAGQEVPAALIADAITVLSNDWNNAHSIRNLGSAERKASNTVISAAFVTGNVPSGSGGSMGYSGGVENFPRFLEDWGGRTLTYRGSMIMLFRSEVATGRWTHGNQRYTAPGRDWGYHSKFGEGYRPPLDLGPRVYRRFHFQELTKDEFEAQIDALVAAYGGNS